MKITLKKEIASLRTGAIFKADEPFNGKYEDGFHWVQDNKSKNWVRIARDNIKSLTE